MKYSREIFILTLIWVHWSYWSILSLGAAVLQELCCTAFPWPGVRINSPGSSSMLRWCLSPSSCQSWDCAPCLTTTTTATSPTSTPCTAGLELPLRLFSPRRYTSSHAEEESFPFFVSEVPFFFYFGVVFFFSALPVDVSSVCLSI